MPVAAFQNLRLCPLAVRQILYITTRVSALTLAGAFPSSMALAALVQPYVDTPYPNQRTVTKQLVQKVCLGTRLLSFPELPFKLPSYGSCSVIYVCLVLLQLHHCIECCLVRRMTLTQTITLLESFGFQHTLTEIGELAIFVCGNLCVWIMLANSTLEAGMSETVTLLQCGNSLKFRTLSSSLCILSS